MYVNLISTSESRTIVSVIFYRPTNALFTQIMRYLFCKNFLFGLHRAKAKMVYACEWNPHAIEALRRNLEANSVADRCVVLEGDNRVTAPKVRFRVFYF